MKLLIYAINYSPELIGAAKYTSEMAAWFAKRGHVVEVITGVPHYPEWEIYEEYKENHFSKEEIDGVQILRTPLYVPKKITSVGRILLEISFSFWSQRYWFPRLFGRVDYDVIIAVCPPMQIAVWPYLFSNFRKIPWIYHIQDLQVDAAFRLQMLKGKFIGNLLYRIENYLLKKATIVSSITEAMCKRISDKGVNYDNIWLVPNWSEIDIIRPLPIDNSFRNELGLTSDQVLFMYAGNMGKKQGLDLIIAAAEHLVGHPKIQFLMIGDGAVSDDLKKIVKDNDINNIKFLPVQPYKRLPEMLAAGDVHLVVQKREAADIVMPSKLTNILAAGRPAIATADNGTTLYQVVEGFNAGIVVPPEELTLFVKAILKLAEDADARTIMGRNARNYAVQNLSKNTILNEFEAKLLRLINHKPNESKKVYQ